MSRKLLVVLAMGGLLVSGCGDSAAPDEFDMVQMQADVDLGFDDETSPENAAIYRGLNLSEDITGEGEPVVASRTRLSADVKPVLSRTGQALSLSRRELPDSVMGKVWIYDDLAGAYVASTRTDGPDDGARFILYAVDDAGFFASPLVETGYLDFRQLGNSERREGEMMAVVDGVTLYDFSGFTTGTIGNGTFGVSGFFTFNGLRVEVDGSGSQLPSGSDNQVELASTVTIPQRDVEIEGSLTTSDASTAPVSLTLTATSPAGVLGMESTQGDDIEGDYTVMTTFSLNGEEFATRTAVDGEPVVYTPLNGNVVTPAHEAFFTEMEDLPMMSVLATAEMLSILGPMLYPVPLAF